jgi:hypothetical protein
VDYWSGSNEQNPKTQGQGSDGYLLPKSTPEGIEAAFSSPERFEFAAAASQSVWPKNLPKNRQDD